MISLRSIREYMLCPCYLYHNMGNGRTENDDIRKIRKDFTADVNDLLQRNLRRVDRAMELEEIKEVLNTNMEDYLNSIIGYIGENSNKNGVENDLRRQYELGVENLALTSNKLFEETSYNSAEVTEMLFPTSMYCYLIKDDQLEIIGSSDKTEIVEGRYFPVLYNFQEPPIRGNWDSDRVVLVANALLIEQEFETEVFVGFVEYPALGFRRPVVMDAQLRKHLFKVLYGVKDILNGEVVPEPQKTHECSSCEFYIKCYEED